MKIVTGAEMRALDRSTIDSGTPSLTLMERAGKGVAEVVLRRADSSAQVVVISGAGNNGGDGFVAARHLALQGMRVRVFSTAKREKMTPDARANFKRLEPMGVSVGDSSEIGPSLARADVILDGIFGTGLDREIRSPLRELIEAINQAPALKIAIDVPSGLHADTGEPLGVAVRADVTATLAFPKIGIVSHPGFTLAGALEVVDIGIDAALAEDQGVKLELIEESLVRAVLPQRARSSHKGNFGHVLVVAGSRDKPGAAILCAEATLRTGAGLCTIASLGSTQQALASRVTEAMTARYSDSDEPAAADLPRLLSLIEGREVVVLGPGIPTGDGMREIVAGVVRETAVPLVLDADALNLLAGRLGALRQARAPIAMTPHPGEMARLTGRTIAEIQADRVGHARRLAAETGAYVALKGARTVVAAPDGRAFINPTGNPGMATAGSGDVLCGMVGALIGQHVPLLEALWCATWLHGAAGDLAVASRGMMGLVARDLLEEIPSVLRALGR